MPGTVSVGSSKVTVNAVLKMPKNSEPLLPENACKEVNIDPEVGPSRPDLVHARTASWVSTLGVHRPWKEKYATRMACLEGGALSGVGVPFKVTGGEITETQKLLTTIFASHPASCPNELLEEYNEMSSEQETYRSRKTDDKFSKSVLELGDPGRFKEAGYDAIKELLRETTERLIAGRGGEPYMEQLEKIKNRKQAAIDAKIKSDPQYPVVRALSNETLRMIYRKKDVTGVQSSKEEDGMDGLEEEEEEMEETVLMGPGCSFETLLLGSEFFIEKLTCILELLCSLQNLRNRQLKTRKPLNRDVVFSLRQFPFEIAKQAGSSSGILLPDINQLTPSSKDLVSASPASESAGLESSHSNLSLGSSLSSAVDSRHLVSFPGTSRLRVGGPDHSPIKTSTQRLEVWEDLMAFETGETFGKSLPTKYRPLWQQTLTRDSLQLHLDGQKSKRTKGNRFKIAMATDKALLVPNFQEFLAQTREKVRRKTLHELEKSESCRLQKFHLIFQSLRSPDEIPEKFFPKMRKVLGKTETEYPTDWFRRLADEAESLQLKTNNKVSDLLKKLKQFAYNQPTDQPLYRVSRLT